MKEGEREECRKKLRGEMLAKERRGGKKEVGKGKGRKVEGRERKKEQGRKGGRDG